MLTLAKLHFDTARAAFICDASGTPIYPGEEMAYVHLADGEQRFEFHICQSVRTRTDEQILSAIIERQYTLTCQSMNPTEFQIYLRERAKLATLNGIAFPEITEVNL